MVTARALRFAQDISPTQLTGFWVGPGEQLLHRPAYTPTGALLPRMHPSGAPGLTCLDLVSVEYAWMPLSEAGMHTYTHSAGLLRREPWQFVVWNADAPPSWFSVELVEALPPQEIALHYGARAALLARNDRNAVQVRLTPVPAQP